MMMMMMMPAKDGNKIDERGYGYGGEESNIPSY